MDTDWCIMCDSHCNISGAIYCSEECKLRDRLENAYYPPSTSSSTTPSSSSSSSSPSVSPLLTSTGGGVLDLQYGTNLKHSSKIQLPPPQQPTLFYHRAPMPRYKPGASNACSNTRNLRVRRMSKSLYVQ